MLVQYPAVSANVCCICDIKFVGRLILAALAAGKFALPKRANSDRRWRRFEDEETSCGLSESGDCMRG
jgi:hypothetical protein